MFFQRKSSSWNQKYRQIRCRDPPLVDAMENGFNLLDMSTLQSSILPSNNVGFDMIQPFTSMSQICTPRAIRRSSSFTDCSSPRMESPLLQQQWTSSSDTSDTSSSDLSDLMGSLSLSQTGTHFPLTEQELSNLRALHTLTSSSALCSVRLPSSLLHSFIHLDNRWSYNEDIDLLEKVARFHRNQAASFFEAACRWEGELPRRFPDNPTFSCKVFLGGVPWDVTEETLVSAFSQFGKVRVEWPGKDQAVNQPKGYDYIVFESEKQVKMLLNNCSCDVSNINCEKWSFRISSKKMKSKEVEVIPWCLSESNFVQLPSQKLDPQTTVFVGALHGMINAEGLFTIMNELFGGVVYTGIDTDKFKYPIGSARVTFNNWQSYMKAVTAAFIEIKTTKFTKKVQVDPYLEDSPCSYCMVQPGPYFCREFTCFRYFCRSCWGLYHQSDLQSNHKPLMRSSKNNNLSFP